MLAKRRAAAMASRPVRPATLSQMPGAWMRGVSLVFDGFAVGAGGEDGVEVGGEEDDRGSAAEMADCGCRQRRLVADCV